jgi:hypothetical protein
MKENEIKNLLVKHLSTIKDAECIAATNFEDERSENMIVVGIESVNQIYPMLPDYEYNVSIVVDTFIEDDDTGKLHENTVKIIQEKLFPYCLKEMPYTDIFGDLPIVGMIFNGINNTISDSSNRCEITLLIYASF